MHVPSRVPSRFQHLGTTLLALFALTSFSALAHAQEGITVRGTDDPRAAQKRSDKKERTVRERVAAGELPPSRLYALAKSEAAVVHRLPRISEEGVQKNQDSFDKPTQMGIVRDLPRPVERRTDATHFVTADNSEAGVLKIIAEGAREIRVRFTEFALPAGARLYVYSAQNPDEVYGPFEGRGTNGDGEFWTPPVKGEAAVIEYVAPGVSEARLPFTVSQVGHIYRDVGTQGSEWLAAPCHRDIPDEWKSLSRSVGLMEFVKGGRLSACTGTLLNSRNNDLTPYFLTANHCLSTQAEARTVNVRWFYDSPNPVGSSYTPGATLLSTGTTTDYTLLVLNGTLPPNLRWAGWTSTRPEISTPVTGIHHPAGDYKRIHFGNLIDGACPSFAPIPCANLHAMRFTSGMGEPGTSGSGLWIGDPSDPLLVGQNLGGDANCTNNQQGVAWYGRFDLTYPQIASFLEGTPIDELEENDTRPAARAINAGNWSGLTVRRDDHDWYRVSVPAGATVTHRISYARAQGDVQMTWTDPITSASVGTYTSAADSRTVTLTNTSDRAIEYFVRVFITDTFRNAYDMSLDIRGGCSYSVSMSSQAVASSVGENRVVTINTTPECRWNALQNPGGEWISLSTRSGTGSGTVGLSITPNYSSQPRTGTLTIGGQTLTVTQEAFSCESSYNVSPTNRSFAQSGGTGRTDVNFIGASCQNWTATSNSSWITINSVSNGTSFNGSYQGAVIYSVAPNSSSAVRTGTLTVAGRTISVTQAGADPQWQPTTLRADQVQFKSWQQRTSQPQAFVKLTFPSTGYRVADWGQAVRSGNNYSVDVVIERFTGESLSVETTTAHIYELTQFPQPGNTFTILLGGGASVTNTITTYTFSTNPVDEARTYVREHYRDFLSREPDLPGLEFWTSEITRCGTDASCTDRQRVAVSASFFLSQEFQATGYYVYRLYRAGLGRVPYYAEFTSDTARVGAGIVVGDRLSPEIINRNKLLFARSFVAGREFRLRFDGKTAAETIDLLVAATGVAPTAGERQGLIDELNATGGTLDERRAAVLMKAADGIRAIPAAGGGVGVDQVFETAYGKAFYEREYNPAFVLMQYFGYLKRDADAAGYRFWLEKLERFGNYRDAEMVRSFVLAAEYRARFGQP